jgi:hypothetical protein
VITAFVGRGGFYGFHCVDAEQLGARPVVFGLSFVFNTGSALPFATRCIASDYIKSIIVRKHS